MTYRLHAYGKPRQVLSAVLPFVLIGCTAVPIASKFALAQSGEQVPILTPGIGDSSDSQLMFELMIAELAGRRGQLDVAMSGYIRAAERTTDPRVADRAAKLAVYGRQWSEAERMARRWLGLEPDSIEGRELLAQVLLRQDKTIEAIAEFKYVLENAEDRDESTEQVLGQLQREPNREQSVNVLEALGREFPDDARFPLGVARLRLAENNREAALQAIDQAITIEPTLSPVVLLRAQILSALGRPAEGFATVEAALAEDPDNRDMRLGYAQLMVEAGRYDDVGAELEKIFALADGDGDVLLSISLLALESRRIEAADGYLQALLETGEFPDEANFYLARIRDQQQEYAEAIEFYNSVGNSELGITAQIRAAELLGITGDIEAGRDKLQTLAATLPNPSLQPRIITAESRILQEGGQSAEAVEVLTEGLARFPDNAEMLYARALAADRVGNAGMLESDLARLIQMEPDNAHALNALGYHLVDANIRLDEAADYLEKAIALQPNDAAIMDSVGWLRYRQGNFAEAAELLRAAYGLFPDGEIAAHLGEVLWVDGREAEAKDVWEKGLAASPDHEKILQVMRKFLE